MTYGELKIESEKFYPAVILDKVLSKKKRRVVRNVLGFIVDVCFAISIIIIFAQKTSAVESLIGKIFPLGKIYSYGDEIYGIFFLSLSFWIVLFSFEAFYNTFYFKGMKPSALEKDYGIDSPLNLETAAVVLKSKRDNLTLGFLESETGKAAMSRLGIFKDSIRAFLHDRKNVFNISNFKLDSSSEITQVDLAAKILETDSEFANFLLQKGATGDDFLGAVIWVERIQKKLKAEERWWGMDVLGKIEGIGKAWSYGQAYLLKRYGIEAYKMPGYFSAETSSSYGEEETSELENVLSKASEANAMLVGSAGGGKMDVVFKFSRKIMEGKTVPALFGKKVIVLDAESIIENSSERSSFEEKLVKIFNECLKAGNIILIIEDFPVLLRGAAALGSDSVSILDPYLASSKIQLVALSDTEEFHELIEPNSKLMSRFEKILVKDASEESLVRIIEDLVLPVEFNERVYFTYQAVKTLASSAERYFAGSASEDKAKDLVMEIIPEVKKRKKVLVGKEDVLELVEEKTGIPAGEVKEDEKKKLVGLEEILHKRIIGQDEAVKSISSAMRRARAGLANPNRPMGSFLFLGPTGVGKTETTKALSEVFFGEKAPFTRLDMSEYNSADSLDKLIGSFEIGKAGILSSKLREQPYGVLLLDEFEKCHEKVHDLFLQILDEGFFSDMSGKKVNARNVIIIATSNAGSDLIWELVKSGKNLIEAKDTIIDEVIKRGIFKPELLNRFDGVIVFHPLFEEDLKKVARLMLSKLESRLKEKGIELVINDALVNFLVKIGSDPKFGARPINRAIQEKVEETIAQKMIKGEVKAGGKIEFKAEELS